MSGKGSCIKAQNKTGTITLLIYIVALVVPLFFLMRDYLNIQDFSLLASPKFLRVLRFSLYQAFLSAGLALFCSILPAYYVYKNKGFVSKLLENAIFIPFFFPPISMVIAFSLIFSNNGVFAVFGLKPDILYTIKAILIAHVFYNSPIFVSYISNALRSINPNLREAAEIDGATPLKKFLRVELPLITPSIIKAFFLVFTYSFMSFAVVINLGGLRFSTVEVAVANALRGSFDFSQALVYALAQFFILFLLNYILNLADKHPYETVSPGHSNDTSGFIVNAVSWLYCLFEYIVVFIGLSGIVYNFYEAKFSLDHFFNLFSGKLNNRFPVVESIINSSAVAGITGIVSVMMAYIILNMRKRITNLIITPVLGISSAFLAIALLYLNILFNIPFFILVTAGYILLTLPISYSFLYNHISGFRRSLEEAGSVDGANALQLFLKIKLPILLPVIIAVFFQIFAIIYGEFTLSYTMQIRDFFPLASVVNFSLSANRYYLESQAFASFNTIIVFALFFISSKVMKFTR